MDLELIAGLPPWEWPEGSGDLLLSIIRDAGAAESDRVLAAELAGDVTVISDELVEVLLSIIRSRGESEELRGAAAGALGPVSELADMDGFEFPDSVPVSERVFEETRASLRKLYMDADAPKGVRRRILEASVRAPQDWHPQAVRGAVESGDQEWKLTAVFCMRYVPGFDEEILEALDSRERDIHYQAVRAAGAREVNAAWPYIARLAKSAPTDKPLLLAAIEAVATIRPAEAPRVLADLLHHKDKDIREAAGEALDMARALERLGDEDLDGEFDDDEDDDDGYRG